MIQIDNQFQCLIYHFAENKILDILNNGTTRDLMELPTIGKKRAEKVIEFRIKNGGFSNVSLRYDIQCHFICCYFNS